MADDQQPVATEDVAARAADALGITDEPASWESEPASEPAPTEPPADPAPAVNADTAPAPDPANVPETVAEAVVEQISEAARFLESQGHKPKKVDGRDVWLPYKTVEGMLGRYADRRAEPLTKEQGTLKSRVQEMETYLDNIRQQAMHDPRGVLEDLAQLNPAFAQYLQAPPARQDGAPSAEDPEPAPDVDLGQGRMTYSLEGLRALRAWERRQTERAVEQRLSQRDQREQAQRSLQSRVQDQIRQAESWDLFGAYTASNPTDFQREVIEEFRRQPSATLRQAYLEVYQRHQSPEKMRERLLAEMKQAPRSTAVSPQAGEARATRPLTTQEVAARALARLEKG